MKRIILLTTAFIGLLVWSCSKEDSTPQSLKQSVERNVADINTAMSRISATKGYQILVSSDAIAKDATTDSFTDSITLGLIAGVYDYQPDTIMMHHKNNWYPFRLFKKTGTSTKMIVNLPQKLVLHPKYLHGLMKDSVLKNDFSITASNYHLYYSHFHNLDYKITADLALNTSALGNFDISSTAKSYKNITNSSSYNFIEGYSIGTSWQTGDTSKASFSLMKNGSILLQENTLFVSHNFHKNEKQYDLLIGNVEIKRGFGIDSIQVFQNGVLQKTAGAKIIDSSDSTGTICNKRDILLTFDDGTTTKLSTLIGPSLTQLKTLVGSLHEMYFAEKVIDYIAISIYYNSR